MVEEEGRLVEAKGGSKVLDQTLADQRRAQRAPALPDQRRHRLAGRRIAANLSERVQCRDVIAYFSMGGGVLP